MREGRTHRRDAGLLPLEHERLVAAIAAEHGTGPSEVHLIARPLRGGLSSAVVRVTARLRDRAGRPIVQRFVTKLLEGDAAREVAIYEQMHRTATGGFGPRFLGVDRVGARSLLHIELVRPNRPWPWRESKHTASVLERLADLHTARGAFPPALPAWDYEAELHASAGALLTFAEHLPLRRLDVPLARSLPALRRLVAALPRIRLALAAFEPFGTAVLHGDVHPGNVVARGDRIVFLDWGRARVGSPLEDVSSWLEALGCWEPETRRRHDTLLRAYLAARGRPPGIPRDVRDAYWLAAACNGLAGAALHHLQVIGESPPSSPRLDSLLAAREWLRVIRRADACWR